MLSLTVKKYLVDMPDHGTGATHPPHWFASVESSLDGTTATFAVSSDAGCFAGLCGSTDALETLLHEMRAVAAGVDTAVYRRFHFFEVTSATRGNDSHASRTVRFALNDQEDRGREPKSLVTLLAWLSEQAAAVGAPRALTNRLSAWG